MTLLLLYILASSALVVAGYLLLHRHGIVPNDSDLAPLPRLLLRLAALPATVALLILGAVLLVCGVAVEMVIALLRRGRGIRG
jgi:hypothetical protein